MSALKLNSSQIVGNDFESGADLENHNLAKSFSIEKLQTIAKCDPYLIENQTLLLAYYKEVKKTWATAIVNRIKQQHKLNLRQKLDRCILAVMAAREKIQFKTDAAAKSRTGFFCSPPPEGEGGISEPELAAKVEQLERQLEQTSAELEKTNNRLNNQVKLNIIVATDRLLPEGPPLNGVEESPMMKILGSPTTLTKLELNFEILKKRLKNKIDNYRAAIKELLLSEDNEKYCVEEIIEDYRQLKNEAVKRLKLVNSIYSIHRDNWDLLKPTIPISDEELQARMNGKIPHGWSPESFWD